MRFPLHVGISGCTGRKTGAVAWLQSATDARAGARARGVARQLMRLPKTACSGRPCSLTPEVGGHGRFSALALGYGVLGSTTRGAWSLSRRPRPVSFEGKGGGFHPVV